MKRFFHLMTAVTVTYALALGCDGTKAVTSAATGFPASATGDNAPVTSATAPAVMGTALGQAFTALGSGFSVLTKPVSPDGNGTVNGTVSGTAKFDGTVSSTTSGTKLVAKVTFDDFSNGGGIWLQGLLDVTLTISSGSYGGSYKGDINIAGDNKAILKMDITINNSIPSGSIEIESDGNTFTYTIPTA